MNSTNDVMRRLKDMIVMGQGSQSETASLLVDALAEIEKMSVALQLAVGELSTYNEYRLIPPDQLYQQFLEEACDGLHRD